MILLTSCYSRSKSHKTNIFRSASYANLLELNPFGIKMLTTDLCETRKKFVEI